MQNNLTVVRRGYQELRTPLGAPVLERPREALQQLPEGQAFSPAEAQAITAAADGAVGIVETGYTFASMAGGSFEWRVSAKNATLIDTGDRLRVATLDDCENRDVAATPLARRYDTLMAQLKLKAAAGTLGDLLSPRAKAQRALLGPHHVHPERGAVAQVVERHLHQASGLDARLHQGAAQPEGGPLAERVQQLEAETRRLRDEMAERDRRIQAQHDAAQRAASTLGDSEQRARRCLLARASEAT